MAPSASLLVFAGKCPMGNAWADIAAEDDKAHLPAECSNRGTCDHSTGLCACMTGYEGLACERSTTHWHISTR